MAGSDSRGRNGVFYDNSYRLLSFLYIFHIYEISIYVIMNNELLVVIFFNATSHVFLRFSLAPLLFSINYSGRLELFGV